MTIGVILGVISGYYATTFIDDIINAVIMTLGSIPLLHSRTMNRVFRTGELTH